MPPGIPPIALLGLLLGQGMPPNHGGGASAPLFVPDLPVGTISVRIARPSMNQALVGTPVVGTWTTDKGPAASATVKTGDDGRAIFANVPAGATFSAQAEVEGQRLTTAEFTVPEQGGTRLLLIVGSAEGSAEGEAAEDGAGHPAHGLAGLAGHPPPAVVRSGKVESRDNLPPGTVEVHVLDADGKPLPGARVDLLLTQRTMSTPFAHASTDDSGRARFTGVLGEVPPPGRWVAGLTHDGLHFASPSFALEDKPGVAVELRIPGKTAALSVLRVSESSRMMVELREDSLAFLQNLVVENTSDQIFDPGPAGVLFPLPDGCTGAEPLEGGAEVEMKEGAGAIWRGPLPPTTTPLDAAQVRLGCVLPGRGTPEVEIVQPMPLGLHGGVAMIQASHTVGLSAPGLRARPAERDDNGNELRSYDLASLTAGQALHLTVYGLPTRGRTGKWIALGLVSVLLVVGIAVAGRPRRTGARDDG
jgi:hypothetical protein